jgi:hypothetical protein
MGAMFDCMTAAVQPMFATRRVTAIQPKSSSTDFRKPIEDL